MKCPSCGRFNRTGAAYCAVCGTRLPGVAREPFDLDEVDTPGRPAAAGTGSPTLREPVVREPDPTGVPTIRLERQPTDDVAVGPRPAAATAEPVARAGEPVAAVCDAAQADVVPGAPEAGGAPVRRPDGPLAVGDLVTGRFEITEIIEQSPERNAYRARDWGRCASCGYDDNARGDRYCLDCGAALDAPLFATISERLHVPPAKFDLSFREGKRDYYVALETPIEAHKSDAGEKVASGPQPRLALRWGRATDPGLAREGNEDYAECWTFSQASGPRLGFFVVADGLGGADSGEVASEMATRAAWGVVRARVWEPVLRGEQPSADAVRAALSECVQEANRAVYEARVQAKSDMSSTVTMALITDGHATIANVGDSRTYRYGAEGLQAITRDHSLVQRLVDTGQISRAQVYTHPQRNLIFQSIGDRLDVQADLYELDLLADDRLILCSDGLWEAVRDEGIEEALLAEQEPQRACERLVRYANLAGGEDNISVIIVQAQADPAWPRS